MLYRFLLLLITSLGFANEPSALFLTWKGDPTTTMTVIWLNGSASSLEFKPMSEADWKLAHADTSQLDALFVHLAELTGLKPDTTYLFRIGKGQVRQFRTLPATLDRPIKVAIGGDAYYTPETNAKMNREVASHAPDFAIVAGDVAYTEGISCALRSRAWKIDRWMAFFKAWTEAMVTEEGRIIPIMVTLGNHDVREGFDNPFKLQVPFYQFFPFPLGLPYQMMKIGGEACLYLLDSGHSFPIGGAQAEWLERSLKENSAALFHIPIYHIAAYPTQTSYSHRSSKDIRKLWCPLFEKYGVKVCMEHDNHTFKRSYPIKEGKIDPEGIYYLGDGAWGVDPLKPHRHWYLAKALQANCFWLLTIDRSMCQFQAFNLQGELLDELSISSKQSYSPNGDS